MTVTGLWHADPVAADPGPTGGGTGGSPRWILHVDMDAFYASVEALDDPGLAGRPLIVGGVGARGVVASCSYEARRFGVRSAMPTGEARRLCPQAVFVAGRYDRYAEVSKQMHAVFGRYTPLVEGISLDEAFLDVSGSVRLFGTPPDIARSIRDSVREELRLACSVGVAPVKFLAKLASEAAKPKATPGGRVEGPGVFVVERGGELAFLHPLPIEALWGVGPKTAGRLRSLGFDTIGDLARVPESVLQNAVGSAQGAHLAALSRGVDERPVVPDREVKSISHEETYATDRRDRPALETEILRMADSVATRMRRGALAGRTVNIKVRYGDFTTVTRSTTSAVAIDDAASVAALARGLLERIDVSVGVRLLGVGVSNLGPAGAGPSEQLALDLSDPAAAGGPARRPSPATTAAIDAVRTRFGATAVGPAALLGRSGLRVKRPGDTQWGPEGPEIPPAE